MPLLASACGGTATADAASPTATGGTAGGTGGTTGTAPSTTGGSGGSVATTAPASGLRCQTADVICDMMPAPCPFGEVPRLNDAGTCYGEGCVAIGDCACTVAADCPDPGQYTCNLSLGRCTPYLD